MSDECSVARNLLRAVVLISFLAGCSSPPEKLGRLDLVQWRQDRSACEGIRPTLMQDFKIEQANLMGKFADEVGQMLGKPDIHQLGSRPSQQPTA